MIWTINDHEPKELGVSGLKLQHANLAAGAFTFTAPGRNIDAAFLFDYGQVVSLRESGGGVRWIGPCIGRPVAGQPGAENHRYTVAGPWWYLEHLPYLQEWVINGGAGTAWLSRCILGVNLDGTRQSIGQAITAVLAYATGCALPVEAGIIDLPGLFPVVEVKGLMCSEVIRRILRWTPDAVAWWTFGDTSQLNIKRRAALATASIAVGQPPHQTVDINPREDMKPSAVVLVYERIDTVDGTPVTKTAVDAAPEGADGRQLGALVYTIPLAGGSTTTVKQRIQVRTIQMTVDPGAPLADIKKAQSYWAGILGLIGKVRPRNDDAKVPAITFFHLEGTDGPYFARELANPSGSDGMGDYELKDLSDDGSEKVRLNATLPRELIGGQVAEWMSGVQAQRQTIRFKISYTPIGETSSVVPKVVSVHLVATDATNRVYSKVDSVIEGESVAAGLAAQMLTALTAPHYQGTVSILEEECGGDAGVGNVLNLTGGRPEWAAMKAVIQQVTEDLDAGRTTYTVGPPEHLGPQDQIELQRCDRRPEGNTGNQNANVTQRSSGQP